MRFVLFYHSLFSDWNHASAPFLRGIATELLERGHEVCVYEPYDGWSLSNLIVDHGSDPLTDFNTIYPSLAGVSAFYDPDTLDLEMALWNADVVIVHEWNDPALINRIGAHHTQHDNYCLLFHDTHTRAVTAPHEFEAYDLSQYDGVLAFGSCLTAVYRRNGWARQVWTWEAAADTRVFHPRIRQTEPEYDVLWVGNWGDDARVDELKRFLFKPVKALGLRAAVYGARYPQEAVDQLEAAGIDYLGWMPNFHLPDALANACVSMVIPRRDFTQAIPGVPMMHVYEALACGTPLVCAPWEDRDRLFYPRDFGMAQNGDDMRRLLRDVLSDPVYASTLAAHGMRTIFARHTCAHRVSELFTILAQIGVNTTAYTMMPA